MVIVAGESTTETELLNQYLCCGGCGSLFGIARTTRRWYWVDGRLRPRHIKSAPDVRLRPPVIVAQSRVSDVLLPFDAKSQPSDEGRKFANDSR